MGSFPRHLWGLLLISFPTYHSSEHASPDMENDSWQPPWRAAGRLCLHILGVQQVSAEGVNEEDVGDRVTLWVLGVTDWELWNLMLRGACCSEGGRKRWHAGKCLRIGSLVKEQNSAGRKCLLLIALV